MGSGNLKVDDFFIETLPHPAIVIVDLNTIGKKFFTTKDLDDLGVIDCLGD